jgi:sugar phosphate isomerase/epimerase
LTEAGLRRRLTDAHVKVTMVDCLSRGLPGLPPPGLRDPVRDANLPDDAIFPADEETCLHCCEALEAPILNVTHFRGTPVPLDQMAEAVGAICRRARARGLQIALEMIPGTGLGDLGFTHAVARTCGEPNCAITLDFCHLDRSGGSVDDVWKLSPGAIAGIQIADRKRPPPGTPHVAMAPRSMPGEGELPLRDLYRASAANSPDMTAEVEVFNSLPTEEAAARTAAALKTWRATL